MTVLIAAKEGHPARKNPVPKNPDPKCCLVDKSGGRKWNGNPVYLELAATIDLFSIRKLVP